jgi:hypothetical protein
VQELSYEPSAAGRPVVVERSDDTTRITVHMQGLYVPMPEWVGQLDQLALVVAPLWWVGTLLVRTILRLPAPPRAVFEIGSDRVKLTLRDHAGGVQSFDFPRRNVVEARPNRFEPGLWLNVTGHVKETFLADLPPETMERLAAELQAALSPSASHS